MPVVDAAGVAAELVRQYCPGAPANVQEAAAAMVEPLIRQGGTDLQQSQLDGEMATFRDAMRADVVRRSGAAGILAAWRRPRARPIEAAS